MCAAGCRPSIMGKIFLKRTRSNNYENFAYGILVRDSGLAGGWRPDDYTTLPLACQVVILHKKRCPQLGILPNVVRIVKQLSVLGKIFTFWGDAELNLL